MSAVIVPAQARPSGESYGRPCAIKQRAEVGVAEAELAEAPGRLGDLLGRVVGVADEDLLCGEHDLDGVLERLDVEGAVVAQERQKVDACEVARRVVEVNVLASKGYLPLIRPGVRRGVPTVDRRVVLHARDPRTPTPPRRSDA